MGDNDLSGCDRLQHLLTVALVDNFLGQVRLSQGDNNAAARLFTDGLTVARRAQDRISLLVSLYDLALSSQAQGDLARAAGHLKEGLGLAAEAGDETSAAYYLEGLAAVAASKTTRSVPSGCSPPPARFWKPKAAAASTRTCHVSRTTTLSWPRCAPAWAMCHSRRPWRRAHPWAADTRESTRWNKDDSASPATKEAYRTVLTLEAARTGRRLPGNSPQAGRLILDQAL